MRTQGVNSVGEEMSSAYVKREDDFGFDTSGPSLTRQEFADECDVNALMARYEKTGQMIPSRNAGPPQYLDLTDVPDLHAAMNIMRDAEAAFMRLPAVVRREFENDVTQFVEFAEDPENLDQMREWGLAKPAEPTPAPLQVQVIGEPSVGDAAPAAPAKPA